jgi:hypothetical protein
VNDDFQILIVCCSRKYWTIHKLGWPVCSKRSRLICLKWARFPSDRSYNLARGRPVRQRILQPSVACDLQPGAAGSHAIKAKPLQHVLVILFGDVSTIAVLSTDKILQCQQFGLPEYVSYL